MKRYERYGMNMLCVMAWAAVSVLIIAICIGFKLLQMFAF